jgi:hypothetical protein
MAVSFSGTIAESKSDRSSINGLIPVNNCPLSIAIERSGTHGKKDYQHLAYYISS